MHYGLLCSIALALISIFLLRWAELMFIAERDLFFPKSLFLSIFFSKFKYSSLIVILLQNADKKAFRHLTERLLDISFLSYLPGLGNREVKHNRDYSEKNCADNSPTLELLVERPALCLAVV